MNTGLASLALGTVYAIYNCKAVPMDYVAEPKDRFKFAAMRVRDNAGEGYVVDADGSIFRISRTTRMAKPLHDRSVLAEIDRMLTANAIPQKP